MILSLHFYTNFFYYKIKLDKGFSCVFHSIQNATKLPFPTKAILYFWLIFPHFFGLLFGLCVTTDFKPCVLMYVLINYVQNEYTTSQCIIIQTSHHMLCILCISMNFFIAKADKMEDSQDLWSTNKATAAAILYLYNIFRQFLKLDFSFPKIKNMIIHKLGFQHCEKKNIQKILVLKKIRIIHELQWYNSSI